MRQLILASGSPRRRELLEQLNISFQVMPSKVDEQIDVTKSPSEIVMELAKRKAEDVLYKQSNQLVLGADTIVVAQGEILGKPANEAEAIQMLKSLSGNTHQVLTGVALLSKGKQDIFYEKTNVTFWDLTDKELQWYVRSLEPMDKAGAYGIQGLGAYLVKEIRGDYFNVVGLPISKVVRKLIEYGIEPK